MEPRYAAALVGLGRIAWRFDAGRDDGTPLTHMGSYLRNPKVKVVSGFSPVKQDRLDFRNAFAIETCDRFEYVLQKRPDIVSICSPSETHFEQTLACLDHQIPMIWLEKPPTLTLGELDALIQHLTYSEGKTKVLVNYWRRYSTRFGTLRAVYQQKQFGRPLTVQVLYSGGLELNGSHFLDFVFFMLGDQTPEELVIPDKERQKTSPTFLMRFGDDFVVSVCGHATPYQINDMVLVCESGRVSALSGGLEMQIEQRVENERYAGFYRLKRTEPSVLNTTEPDDSFPAALADLIHAHETNTQPRSSLATARCTQAVIEQIRRG